MPNGRQKKKASDITSAEEFSDVDSSLDTDESASDTQDTWTFPVVPHHGKRQEFELALKSTQIKIGELQDQVRKLRLQNSELRATLKGKKNVKKGFRNIPSGKDKLIGQQAKKFGVMHEIFLLPGALGGKRPLTNSMDAGRYGSELAELNGMTAEVFEALPDDMHHELETSLPFRSLFTTQLNSGRRSIIHQFRSGTAAEIFGLPIQCYRLNFSREEVPEMQLLMRFSTDQDKYPKFPPILFPDHKIRNMATLFQCVKLANMLKTILFGGTSISSNKPPAPKTQGKVWQVTGVTPGAIAFMAVLAIFLHSPDHEFAPIGAKTKIPYGKRFTMFKQFLMVNAHRDHIKNLYRWWNRHVFSFATSQTTRKEDDGEDSGMGEAEAALNSDEEFRVGNEEFANGVEDWYALEGSRGEPAWPLNNHSADLSIDFVQLTVSDTEIPMQVPAAASSHRSIAATRVRGPNVTLSKPAVPDNAIPGNIPGKSSNPRPRPRPRTMVPETQDVDPADKEISATRGDQGNPPHERSSIGRGAASVEFEDPSTNIQALLEDLLVDDLKIWVQDHGIALLKARRKADIIGVILNAPSSQQPTSADIEILKASRMKGKMRQD